MCDNVSLGLVKPGESCRKVIKVSKNGQKEVAWNSYHVVFHLSDRIFIQTFSSCRFKTQNWHLYALGCTVIRATLSELIIKGLCWGLGQCGEVGNKWSINRLCCFQWQISVFSLSLFRHYFCSSETFISRALPSTVFQATDCKKRRDFLEALYSTSPFASLFTESSKPKEPSALYETFTKVERAGSKPPIGPVGVSNNKGPSNHRRDLAASRHFEFPRSSSLIRTGSIQDLSSSGDSIMWPEIRPDSGHCRDSSNQSNPDEVMSGRGSRAWSGSSRGDLELTQDSLELDQEDVPLSRSLFRR